MRKIDEKEILRNFVLHYLGYWKWFAASCFVCACLAVVYVKSVDKVYHIAANILVKSDDDSSGGLASMAMKSFSLGFGSSVDVQDELEILGSFTLLRKTVEELDLYTEYSENSFLKSREKYKCAAFKLDVPYSVVDTMQSGIKFSVESNPDGSYDISAINMYGQVFENGSMKLPAVISPEGYGTFVLRKSEFFEEGKSYDYTINVLGLDVAAQDYMKILEVDMPNKKANVVSLIVEDSNVQKSKDFLNKIVEKYNQTALEEKDLVSAGRAKFIESRLESISKELQVAEDNVETFKKQNKTFDMTTESKILLEENGLVRGKILEVETQMAIVASIENYLGDEKTKFALLPDNLVGVGDETASGSFQSYNALLLERISLLNTTNEKNPGVKKLDMQIDAMRQSVLLSVKNLRDKLTITKKELEKQNGKFARRYAEAPTLEKEFRDIMRTQLIKEQLVIFLMEKREENSLSAISTKPQGKVIDAAYSRTKPVFPNKWYVLAVFLALGGMIPLIAIYIKDMLKVTFSSKAEVEGLTSVPVIGEVYKSDSTDNIVVRKDDVSTIPELFRLIRTNIQFVLNKRSEKVLLVTSTQSGEGKSFISINLAMSMALTNKKILLVGLDIRSPKLVEYLGVKSSDNGVTNYLSDESLSPADLVMKSVFNPNLDVVVAGPVPPNPGELLLSDRLDLMIEYFRKEYDYIFLDSAPIGMVSDSYTLDRLSDMTLYVTRANYTAKQTLSFVEEVVDENKLRKLYLVVNGTEPDSSYGYGYGYGANASSGAKKHKK